MNTHFKEKLSELAVTETLSKITADSSQQEYDDLFLLLSKTLFKINHSTDILRDLKNGAFEFITIENYSKEISEITSSWLNNLPL